jgi:hypothetical protein
MYKNGSQGSAAEQIHDRTMNKDASLDLTAEAAAQVRLTLRTSVFITDYSSILRMNRAQRDE